MIKKFKSKLKRIIYVKCTQVIALAAQSDRVRSYFQAAMRLIARSMPDADVKMIKERWLSDFAFVMHEASAGAWICKSHTFGRILGPTKTISFIFPYYRKKDEILAAIESLKSQDFYSLSASDIEIIVIEDGSSDNLDDILPNDVMYIRRNKFGYGISRCRNLGAKISSGSILCFVDPDFIFPRDYVENLYSEFKRFGRSNIITGYIHDYFYKGCEDPRTAFGAWEVPDRPTNRFLQLAGGHMAIDRNLFFSTGGFDEDLIYGEVEDTFFGYLLSKRDDITITFSTKVQVRHIPHPVGLAHKSPAESFRVSAFKDPEFFHKYVIEGCR